nr:gonadotropin-releasing hormone/corazonin protein [Lymnaea stagnalis]
MTSSNLMSTLLVLILVLLAVVHTTTAQNYHFSNGWYAGKKRSSPSYTGHIIGDSSSEAVRGPRTADEACNIRPEAVLLINRIIQEEVARIQKVCTAETPSGLREILENAATRLDSESKW